MMMITFFDEQGAINKKFVSEAKTVNSNSMYRCWQGFEYEATISRKMQFTVFACQCAHSVTVVKHFMANCSTMNTATKLIHLLTQEQTFFMFDTVKTNSQRKMI